MGINPQSISNNMRNAVDALIALRERLNRCGQAYHTDFEKFWEETVPLMFDEVWYYAQPDSAKSRDLDDRWSDWANRLYRHLQNSALDLDFSYERDRLREFLRLLTDNRKSV